MKSEKVYLEYLLLKLQAGDDVMDTVVRILASKVKAFTFKIMGDHEAVEDCAQDALLQVMQHIKRIKSVPAVHTWVYKVTHSACMNHLRKNRQHESDDALLVMASAEQGLNGDLDVKTAIKRLSQMHQMIVYLFYYEGFNIKEIADVVSKPAGTIKYELFEARGAIKAFLTNKST